MQRNRLVLTLVALTVALGGCAPMTVQAPVPAHEGLKNGDWMYAAYLANGDNGAVAADAVESLAGLLPG